MATPRTRNISVTGTSRPQLPRHAKLRFDDTRQRWVILAPERVLAPDDIAVEVLSPYDKQEEISEGVKLYLDKGVRTVWIVDPFDCTVKVYRKNREPQGFNIKQTIPADPALPGLKASVAEIFEY